MTPAENERITRVGPGTPMGELLRRYWMPIAISSAVGARPVARRILGEDLVVFRDAAKELGVVERYCAHRRSDLSIGICEERGIRCGYHGWLYARDGQCVEQPAEIRLNPKIKIRSYPVQELGGLIFVYMGPQPAPLLPRFDLFVWDEVLRDIGEVTLGFNCLQAMENSVDPHHSEWLHGHYMNFHRRTSGNNVPIELMHRKHVKVAFEPFEFGIIKRRLLEGQSEDDDDWKIGHPLIFPNMLRHGAGGIDQVQIRVPVDDTHTWHLWYTTYRVEGVRLPRQDSVPSYKVPLTDDHGDPVLDYIDGQDIACWAGQGAIADRTKENLAGSDAGVAILRRMYFDQMNCVAAGQDPLGTVRDAGRNTCIDLPRERERFGSAAAFQRVLLNDQAIRYSTLRPQLLQLYGIEPSSVAPQEMGFS